MVQNTHLRLLLCSLCCLILVSSCHSMRGNFYRVEKGDSLWRIAHVNGVEIDEIQRANPQLDIDHLTVGEKIFLPSVLEVKSVPKQKLNVSKWIPSEKPKLAQNTVSKKPTSQNISHASFQFIWPYRGTVISSFGKQGLKMHNGIDIQLPPNQFIGAAASGKVVYVGNGIEGYDQIVIILHEYQLFTIYAFVGDFLVKEGTYVQSGTPVARARNISPKSFFHFEIRHIKTSLDPLKYLR